MARGNPAGEVKSYGNNGSIATPSALLSYPLDLDPFRGLLDFLESFTEMG